MKSSGQLPYADFFRALAIFYVFLAHAGGFAREPHLFHHVAFSDAVGLFDGVAMLFCLSGFLLSAPLLRAYLDTPHDLPLLRPYLLARFLRIYPLYAAAVLTIAAYLALAGTPVSAADIALHLTMLQNFSAATIQSLAGPLWTMPLDAQFYLVLPLGFALAARALRGHPERTRIVVLAVGLAAIVAASVAYRFAVVWRWSPVGLDDQLAIVEQFPGMAALFAFGIAARFLVLLAERGTVRLRPNAALLAGLVATAIACRWLQAGAHAGWLHLASTAHSLPSAAFAAVEVAFAGAGCACLLVAANYARNGWFGRLASSPVVAYAAAISYGFYLFHYTVLAGLHARVHGAGARALAVLLALALLVLVPLCTAAYYLIEKRFLERKARLQRVRVAGRAEKRAPAMLPEPVAGVGVTAATD